MHTLFITSCISILIWRFCFIHLDNSLLNYYRYTSTACCLLRHLAVQRHSALYTYGPYTRYINGANGIQETHFFRSETIFDDSSYLPK